MEDGRFDCFGSYDESEVRCRYCHLAYRCEHKISAMEELSDFLSGKFTDTQENE